MKDTDKSKKKAQVQAVKDASSDVYEVQEIIRMDKVGDKSVFLVTWVGYDDVTWEPASNIPSGVVKSFKAKIKQHSEKCAAGQIQECLDMVDASMDGGVSAWLFQVSWSGCGHKTWEPEADIAHELVAAIREKASSDDTGEVKAVEDATVDDAVIYMYEVEEVLTMDKIGNDSTFLVSWVGYDDVTWEPARNIAPGVVKTFKAKLKQHAEKCKGEIQECLDMVDASKDEDVPVWLFKVSWSGCSHKTWEPQAGISEPLVAAFRHQANMDETGKIAHTCVATGEATNPKANSAEGTRHKADGDDSIVVDNVAVPGNTMKAVEAPSLVQICPVCKDSDDLGSNCASCKGAMHHFCATTICQELGLKNTDGTDMEEFPNDVSYCSRSCYFGHNIATATALGKRNRSQAIDDHSDQSEYREGESEEMVISDEEDHAYQTSSRRKKNKANKVPVAAKSNSKRKQVGSVRSRSDPKSVAAIIPSSNAGALNPKSGDKGDPLLYQMVAFSADHEDWMETEVPVSKTKTGKVRKSRPAVYASARGQFLTGRIHRARTTKGVAAQVEKKYEVRWNHTGFNKPQHIHKLTAAQVERGMSNYKALHADRLTSATFAQICKVPESEEVDLNVDLDDYVIMDAATNDMIMEQEYPENLKVIEELKSLEFQTNRKIEAPQDLYTHEDGTYKTKLKKGMSRMFDTASSSFFAYLPVPFWRTVVDQTNMYAKNAKEMQGKQFKSALITLEELIKFLGILFYMTVVSKGEFSNYWGEQIEGKILGVSHAGLEKFMSRKRFMYIRSNLCFLFDVTPAVLKKDPAARRRVKYCKSLEIWSPPYCIQCIQADRKVSFQDLCMLLLNLLAHGQFPPSLQQYNGGSTSRGYLFSCCEKT